MTLKAQVLICIVLILIGESVVPIVNISCKL